MTDHSAPLPDTSVPPPADEPRGGVPQGASELGEVVERMAGYGYGESFTAELDGASAVLWCPSCAASHPAATYRRAWTVRLEGASDPADMLHVSALRCPACGTGGAFVSPFGVNAGEADAAVLLVLPDAEQSAPDWPG
jgi:hypothetical protein